MADVSRPCTGYDLKSGRPCTRAAARDIKAGCVHEHVGTHRLCLCHTDDVANGLMKCGRCLEVDGHACKLIPLDPASVKVPRSEWMRELLGVIPHTPRQEPMGDGRELPASSQ